jgi:hypothetical protein
MHTDGKKDESGWHFNPVSPGYLDTGHYRYTVLICIYLSLLSSLLISGKKGLLGGCLI